MNFYARLILPIFALATFSTYAIASGLELDLNGFRLQQFISVVEPALGPHFQTIDQGDIQGKAYGIDDNSYMIVYYRTQFPNHIDALQLTGTSSKAPPFNGLKLGDPIEKVIGTFGAPSKVKNTELQGVRVYNFENKNFSIEIDKNDQLYSIRIYTNAYLVNEVETFEGVWQEFKEAVISKSHSRVIELLRPDFEIYKGSKTISNSRRYNEFIKDPDSEFLETIFAEKNSVYYEISRNDPEDEAVRAIQNFGVGLVFKYPKSEVIREIVFFPYNGKLRIYEIAFHQ